MPLATALPDGLITDTTGGGSLIIPSIELSPTAIHQNLGFNAASLFPARGTILIGNEHLSYTSITEIPSMAFIKACANTKYQWH